MAVEQYNLIFTVVEALEANARLDFGDDSKYVRYAVQIRDLLRAPNREVTRKEPVEMTPNEFVEDLSKIFDEDTTIDADMQICDPSEPPAKTSVRANDCKAIDTDRQHIHTASMLEDERFRPRQLRVIAQRILNEPLYAKLDGYLVLCTEEKRRVNVYKAQLRSGRLLVKPETDICTPDEIADIDLHFECTTISLKRKGNVFDSHEHVFIAQHLYGKYINRDTAGWQVLSPRERMSITACYANLKRGKRLPIDPRLVNAERICWHFDLDWNTVKEGL